MTKALVKLRQRASGPLTIMTCLFEHALNGRPASIGTVALGHMLQHVFCVSGEERVSIFKAQSSTSWLHAPMFQICAKETYTACLLNSYVRGTYLLVNIYSGSSPVERWMIVISLIQ